MDLNRHLAELREAIPEIAPREAHALAGTGSVLVDVREAAETAEGMAEHARAVPRGYLEMRIGDLVADTDQPVLLMCGSGTRSLLAADDLRRLGYDDVRSVAGGFSAWKAAGLPVVMPELDTAFDSGRYARQISLPEIGLAGQRRLAEARVLLVGAGGLGCPAALYLAAAGVGTLGLVDDDRVERSNLHRQVLHRDDRVGWDKTASARAMLTGLNPEIDIRTHRERLTADNATAILGDYDLVVDGCDNFATRYLVSDTCRQLGLTSVYGAVQGFEGQVSVFAPGRGPCYRCLFADAPPPELAPSCSEAGVLGVAPGIIGLLQALEALKLIAGFGEPLIGRLLLFDARRSRLRELRLPADPDCVCTASASAPDHVGARSAADAITGLVLAGGAGRRMGGRDKGLIELAGRPLTAWSLDGLRPQVQALLISANRELNAYRAWGVPVVTDAEPDFPGPLAGVLAGLRAADTGWLLSLPCDAPAVPPDLARRLHAAVIADDAELAVARSAGRLHPLHALWSTALAGDLAAGLAAGQRKVTDWQNTRRQVIVDFDQQPEAFENVNTPDQLAAYAARRDAAHGP